MKIPFPLDDDSRKMLTRLMPTPDLHEEATSRNLVLPQPRPLRYIKLAQNQGHQAAAAAF
jgi:hypothetical protein